jgi:S1-C subfamily serine protease
VGVAHQDISYEARVADSMVSRDLCLLDVSDIDAPAIALGRAEDLRVGQRVFALGAPQGLELTFSEGMVSSLRGNETLQLIQTSAPISPGSSGGALLASDGKLIGITTMGSREGQNLNFAVPADWIADFRTLRQPPR